MLLFAFNASSCLMRWSRKLVVVMGNLFATIAKRHVDELGKRKKIICRTVLLAPKRGDNKGIFILVPHMYM